MVFRRRYKKKFYRRKKRYTRKYTRAGRGSKGVRFFKLRQVTNLVTSVGGAVSFFNSANPSDAFNNGGTDYEDWTNVYNLFDSFRVRAIKLKFIPSLPNDTSGTTAFSPLYVGGDPDSSTIMPVTTILEAVQYENMKVKNMFRPWSYYFKLPKPGATPTLGWCDVASPTQQLGMIWAYGTGFDISTGYGTMISTIYLQARDRR